MCILVLKKKGVCYPTERIVRNCINANPDGFAMSLNFNGKVFTYTSLDAEDFIRRYKSITAKCDRKDTAMMLHMRIATHGSVRIKNCHGWKGNILGTEMAFAHNGILRIPNRDDMTDSETFLRDYLEPCQTIGEFMTVVHDNIGGSKFGFVDGDGNIMHFGHFNEDRGVMYSNTSYIGRRFCCDADPRLWGKAL